MNIKTKDEYIMAKNAYTQAHAVFDKEIVFAIEDLYAMSKKSSLYELVLKIERLSKAINRLNIEFNDVITYAIAHELRINEENKEKFNKASNESREIQKEFAAAVTELNGLIRKTKPAGEEMPNAH